MNIKLTVSGESRRGWQSCLAQRNDKNYSVYFYGLFIGSTKYGAHTGAHESHGASNLEVIVTRGYLLERCEGPGYTKKQSVLAELSKTHTERERVRSRFHFHIKGRLPLNPPPCIMWNLKHKLQGEPVIMTIFSYPWAVTTILREKEKKINVHNPMRSLSLCGL